MVDTETVPFVLDEKTRFMLETEDETTLQGENEHVSNTRPSSETFTSAGELEVPDWQTDQEETAFNVSSETTELNFSERELHDKVDNLNCAITSGDLGVLRQFIEGNEQNIVKIAVTSTSNHSESPITHACTLGLINVLELFAHHKLLFNIGDKEGFYPIHRATYNGHVAVVKYLADQFGNDGLDKKTRSGFSALHIAASVGNGDIVKLLVKQVTHIDQKCEEGWTALHIGAQGGYLQVVQILLEHSAAVDLVNKENNTALYLAVEHCHTEVAEELIRGGASCNHQNDSGVSPLYMAIQAKNNIIAKMLLESGANVNIQDKLGWSPLHKATHMNDEELVFMLLDNEASTNIQNTKGVTSLHLAITNSNNICAQLLLLQGADCNLRDNYGISPFHAAVKSSSLQLVNMMIRQGANLDSYNNDKSTALYVACHKSDTDMIATLLCAGAAVNEGREDGWSPLHVAVQNDVEAAIGMLIYANADPNKMDKLGLTPLAMAARKKSMNILKRIVVSPKCATPEAVFRVSKLGDPALLEKLRSCGISLIKEDSDGTTSVHMAAASGSVEALDALLASNCKVNLQDKAGNTPLHLACAQGHTRIVHALLNMDAQINIPNRGGERCLHLAASQGHLEVINVLLSKAVVLNVKDSSGVTPLLAAIRARHIQTADKLLKCGAKVNISTYGDVYPVHAAAEGGLTQLFPLLVSRGADVNKKGTFDNTCLHLSAKEGHLDSVLELVLNFGAEVNAENVLGKKALHFAADEGHMGIVQALLEAGTKINLLGDDESPLYELARHKDIWDILKLWTSGSPNGAKAYTSQKLQTSGSNRVSSHSFNVPDQGIVSLMWTLGAGAGHSSRSRTQCESQLSRSNTYGGARPRTSGSRSGQMIPPQPTAPPAIIPASSEPPPYSRVARSRSLGRSPNRSGSSESSQTSAPQPQSSHRPSRLLPESPSFLGSLLHAGPAQPRSHSPSPQRHGVESMQNERRGSAASVSPNRGHQTARATLSAPGSVSPHQSPSPVLDANLMCIQNSFGYRTSLSGRPPPQVAMVTSQARTSSNPSSPPAASQVVNSSRQSPEQQQQQSCSTNQNSIQMELPGTPEIRRSSHPGVLTLYFDCNNSSPVAMSPTSRSANPSPGYLNCTPVTSPRQPNLSPSRIPAQHSSQSPPSITGSRSRAQAEAFTFGKETTC